MRKVTHKTVSAFLDGRACNEGNSSTDGRQYALHGNVIANLDEHGTVFLRDCGWLTRTTMDRLNAILDMTASGKYLCQRKHKWYVGDRRDHSLHEWAGSMSVSQN